MSVTSRQKLIESDLAQDFQQGQLAEQNSQPCERRQPYPEESIRKGAKEEPAGEVKHRKPVRNEADSGSESDNSQDLNIIYVTIPEEKSRERKKQRRQDKPSKVDQRAPNRSRQRKTRRQDRNSDDRSNQHDVAQQPPPQQVQHGQYPSYEQGSGYSNAPPPNMAPVNQGRYMHPMAHQQMMGMPHHMGMQGMQQGNQMGYPGYMPQQYLPNPQSKWSIDVVYSQQQMNYYYQMQNYQQQMMGQQQQHQSKQQHHQYMPQKAPMQPQYMSQHQQQQHQLQQQQYQQQHQQQQQANQRAELYEHVKSQIRGQVSELPNKEEVLRVLRGLLDKKDNEEELGKLEVLLNDQATKRALGEIMKVLKMQDVLMKIKQRRLMARLMTEPTIPSAPQQPLQRKDPRRRE